MMQYWSWLLAIIGVTGIFFVGRKTIWGWHILLLNETLWITYAVITKQYGFIFSALAYGVVYIKSYMLWRKEDNSTEVSPYETHTHGSIDHRFIKLD
jgi:nicotinamide riboside transporter PnuC